MTHDTRVCVCVSIHQFLVISLAELHSFCSHMASTQRAIGFLLLVYRVKWLLKIYLHNFHRFFNGCLVCWCFCCCIMCTTGIWVYSTHFHSTLFPLLYPLIFLTWAHMCWANMPVKRRHFLHISFYISFTYLYTLAEGIIYLSLDVLCEIYKFWIRLRSSEVVKVLFCVSLFYNEKFRLKIGLTSKSRMKNFLVIS